MKSLYFTIILVLMFSLLLMPLCALKSEVKAQNNTEIIRVFITETAEIKEVSAKEYSVNVSLFNLSKSAHKEAIKAEIIAAYTKALFYKNENKNTNFDINDSSDGFLPLEKLEEKIGEDFNTTYSLFCDCADEVFGKQILYNNAPILAERHNLCAGVTEDAKNLLNGEFPYLISVESAGDLLCENLLSEKTFSLEEMNAHLTKQGLTPSTTPNEYFKILETSKAGRVLKAAILNKEYSGEEMKNIFNLPSACFSVSFKDNAFLFTTKGEGSFLGLSRAGAEYMAQNGSDYTQILSWYYPGCVLKQ